MKFLSGDEEKNAIFYLSKAAELARKSECLDAKCGSVIVNNGLIIGSGYNKPAGNNRRCGRSKESYHRRVTDKTCCVHAEERAIMDALCLNQDKIKGSRIYFIRVDEKGGSIKAGRPYCTICSKLALDRGIEEFVLWHEDGVCVYTAEEYDSLSADYSD